MSHTQYRPTIVNKLLTVFFVPNIKQYTIIPNEDRIGPLLPDLKRIKQLITKTGNAKY